MAGMCNAIEKKRVDPVNKKTRPNNHAKSYIVHAHTHFFKNKVETHTPTFSKIRLKHTHPLHIKASHREAGTIASSSKTIGSV